jgi:hypothetical protein
MALAFLSSMPLSYVYQSSSHPRPTFFAQSFPFAERSRIVKLHTMIVVRLQEVKDDEELCQISQNLSSRCFERAHTLAKAWIIMDK